MDELPWLQSRHATVMRFFQSVADTNDLGARVRVLEPRTAAPSPSPPRGAPRRVPDKAEGYLEQSTARKPLNSNSLDVTFPVVGRILGVDNGE